MLTPEEIEARIKGIGDKTTAEIRALANELMGRPPTEPPVEPPIPPPPPPPAHSKWDWPVYQYRQPKQGCVRRLARNRFELLQALLDQRPGDVTDMVTGDYGKIDWMLGAGHRSGTGTLPITVQAMPGERPICSGAGTLDNMHALRIEGLDHVHVQGITCRNSQFPLRFWGLQNWSSSHMTVEDAGHAGISIQRGAGRQNINFRMDATTVRRTGRSTPSFGEGIYLGNGSVSWIDTPTNGVISHFDISETNGDGVDIKAGTKNLELAYGKIHEINPVLGSAITHTNARVGDDDPNPEILKKIWMHDLDIWNVGWGSGPSYGITCHLGGEHMERIRMFGFKPDSANCRGLNVRGTSKSSTFPITILNSVIWVSRSIVRYYDAGIVPPDLAVRNVRTPDGLERSTKAVAGSGWPAVNVRALADMSDRFGAWV